MKNSIIIGQVARSFSKLREPEKFAEGHPGSGIAEEYEPSLIDEEREVKLQVARSSSQ